MKIPHKNREKKDKVKKKAIVKPKKEQVLVVAQEIKFARLLSGNEKKSRDKVLKTLKKWLLNCFEKKYEFKEDDFVRMWKGLFYAVWMSDKPLIQEELCESISAVLDLFPPEHLRHALLMYKAGLRVLATEWYGVDHHRMDKFLMLVRRYLRASLRCLLRSKWNLKSCQLYGNIISGSDGIFSLKTPRYARNATSMLLHIIDCYLEEIAKVSNGDIPAASLAELLRPFCSYMCSGEAPTLCAAARRLLTALLRQSEQGIKYQQATAAWQKMGCPEGGPEALELVSDDDEDEQNGDVTDDEEEDSSSKPLDPRAGRVNVELPLLPVPASLLADMLRDMLANATSKAHKRVRICLQRFEQLSRDEYPLTIKTHVEDSPTPTPKPKQVAHSLHVLEKKLVTASDELALRGLSRKHRKRLLAKSRSGQSIVEDVENVRQNISNATNGAWKVEESEPPTKKPKQDADKENKKRKRDTKIAQPQKSRTHTNGEVSEKKVPEKKLKVEKLDNNNENVKITKVKENGVAKEKQNSKSNIKQLDNKTNINSNKKDAKTQEKPQTNGNVKTTDTKIENKKAKTEIISKKQSPIISVNKVKNFQKNNSKSDFSPNKSLDTPKKVKFVLKNNSMQAPVDYYKSIRQSPNIPFDSSKKPSKTNLKPSTPSPINPFFKKKLKLKQ
ncbi:ribosomal RNA processing protein 1 homolog Nnp-1 [Anticarsia gemmatalis]|uniref:ribosomal RNA processing protein 1 homolog Nnp-1 n=1 Tax=Anticarsia gemmatalis TaxID=129554 RepID=UPI003F75A3C3